MFVHTNKSTAYLFPQRLVVEADNTARFDEGDSNGDCAPSSVRLRSKSFEDFEDPNIVFEKVFILFVDENFFLYFGNLSFEMLNWLDLC